MMIPNCKRQLEIVDGTRHPEHQVRDTRVSEYYRKYGVRQLEDMPSDSRPLLPPDERTTDEMLSDDSLSNVDLMSFDELDAISMLNDHADQFAAAKEELELTQKQAEEFDNALKVLNDEKSTFDQKREAYEILQDLERSGKVKRTRARKS